MSSCGLFCAIDANSFEDAAALVKKLAGIGVGIKLGLEFFVAEGPQGVDKIRALAGANTEIFLDLKLHDIPNTVAGAVRAAMKCRPDFVTLHCAGGKDMMRAALTAASETAAKTNVPAPKLLGVTVLTHLDDLDLAAIGQGISIEEQVLRLAKLADASGLQGIVCSPQEIKRLRGALSRPLTLVVPGIRPEGAAPGDQKRVMTPAEAAKLGADYLVIGRPISQAADPAATAREILASIKRKAA
jgi:orotidine-5'-phosphate decarboxylase